MNKAQATQEVREARRVYELAKSNLAELDKAQVILIGFDRAKNLFTIKPELQQRLGEELENAAKRLKDALFEMDQAAD